MTFEIDPRAIQEAARKEVMEEKFRQAVEREKIMLRWPWYKRLFPYKIQIIDLRKEVRNGTGKRIIICG